MLDASGALQYMASVLNDYEAQNQILQDENARFKEALEKQILLVEYLSKPSGLTAYDMADIARAALGKED
jgi:hypothetical protein